ncbi:hypothetical protein K440DRAFT_423899 [Wilcoxina mikolae CBS 423.85]|nr:hypothetical protein K440DRAFT_423899 [Wilcoxina mikolae CBS 423.85]
MEMIIWGYAENRILSDWFPAMTPERLKHMAILDEEIRGGDTSGTTERAEFWRVYTASLLYQNPQVQARLKDVNTLSSNLCKLFSTVQADPSSITALQTNSFHDCLHSVLDLAAQLRCQRGVYEVDESVQLKDRYDDERMVDIDNPDRKDSEDVDRAFVSGIVSKGVVRSSVSSNEAQEMICKARVLVSINIPEDE